MRDAVEGDADLDFLADIVDYPLAGSHDKTTYPGEIEFSFVDSAATATTHFWRVTEKESLFRQAALLFFRS